MFRRSLSRSRLSIAVLVLAAALAGTAAAATGTAGTAGTAPAPTALEFPSPRAFVTNLDLDCFRTSPYTPPPLPGPLTLRHLNPELAALAPWTVASLGVRQQLCVPVAKNGVIPPPEVLAFIRFVDLSCYRITGPAAEAPLVLEHLNPVLSHLPRREVRLMEPQQLCLPVIKNDSVPPDEVLRLVRYIDLACFREIPQVPMNEDLKLTQLNPVLTSLPTTAVRVDENRQLCVPVRKNNQVIPDPVLKIVQWIDLEKYDVTTPALPSVDLRLRHINPLFQGFPVEPATIMSPRQLAVPVAKNGRGPTA